jgi:predicted nucleic acid-binding Zn ribbon protein
MTRSRRDPRPLSFALAQIQDELAPATVLGNVQRVWREVVGDAVAAHAKPTSERGGVLTVSCSASVWAQELDLMGPPIVEGLNAALGSGPITRLRCVATPALTDP